MPLLTVNSDPAKLWGDQLKIVTDLAITLPDTILAGVPADITIKGTNVAGLPVVLTHADITCTGATLNITASDENGAVGTVTFESDGKNTLTIGYDSVEAVEVVDVEPSSDYSKKYLTFEALESGTFTLTVPASITSSKMTSVSYSIDNGTTWNDTAIDSTAQTITTPIISQGNSVLWKGIGNNLKNSNFAASGNFNSIGNIMSLFHGDDFADKTTLTADGCLSGLFSGNQKIVSAQNLILPATTLTPNCYENLFGGCTSLTVAPELHARTAADRCYSKMYQNCTSLTVAPALPATTLANNSYQYMFNGCTSLSTAPTLAATTLADYCCQFMFQNCTSLTTAPELPATTLAIFCYQFMFDGCTSLTTAPELPATNLAINCYSKMFQNCTSLTVAPDLPATTLRPNCYAYMFRGCRLLWFSPELPATTLANECYEYMFSGCNSLRRINMRATDVSAWNSLYNWVLGVPEGGTFTKSAAVTLPSGSDGIPLGWSVVEV